jgi:isoleucyl-tRNA synthetase
MMLSRLYHLHLKVTQGYEQYDYHQVYHALYQFCTVDLSSFYLDILKDRLYASAPNSSERRNAQFVLYTLADCLIRYMVPVLSFSSEAMYAHLPKKSGQEVKAAILLDWPELPETWGCSDLEELYDELNSVRDAINKVVEQARGAKVIGSTLDAQIELWAEQELHTFVQKYRYDWSDWLIASKVILYDADSIMPDDAVASDLSGMAVRVSHAPGVKCDRCWTYSEDSDANSLCPRCIDVMKSLM